MKLQKVLLAFLILTSFSLIYSQDKGLDSTTSFLKKIYDENTFIRPDGTISGKEQINIDKVTLKKMGKALHSFNNEYNSKIIESDKLYQMKSRLTSYFLQLTKDTLAYNLLQRINILAIAKIVKIEPIVDREGRNLIWYTADVSDYVLGAKNNKNSKTIKFYENPAWFESADYCDINHEEFKLGQEYLLPLLQDRSKNIRIFVVFDKNGARYKINNNIIEDKLNTFKFGNKISKEDFKKNIDSVIRKATEE